VQSGGIEGATRSLCERARTLLASGRELETMVPWPLRPQLALYRLGGLAILDAIEGLGYRTDLQRPHVSSWAKLRVFQRAIRQSLREEGDARKLGTA